MSENVHMYCFQTPPYPRRVLGVLKQAGLLAHGHRFLDLPVETVVFPGCSHSQWRDRVGFSPNFPFKLAAMCRHLFAFRYNVMTKCIIHDLIEFW